MSQGERRTCKSNCFNPLKHLSSFSRGRQGARQRRSDQNHRGKTKPVAVQSYDVLWSASCAVHAGLWMTALSNYQICFLSLSVRDGKKLGQSFLLSAVTHAYIALPFLVPSTNAQTDPTALKLLQSEIQTVQCPHFCHPVCICQSKKPKFFFPMHLP